MFSGKFSKVSEGLPESINSCPPKRAKFPLQSPLWMFFFCHKHLEFEETRWVLHRRGLKLNACFVSPRAPELLELLPLPHFWDHGLPHDPDIPWTSRRGREDEAGLGRGVTPPSCHTNANSSKMLVLSWETKEAEIHRPRAAGAGLARRNNQVGVHSRLSWLDSCWFPACRLRTSLEGSHRHSSGTPSLQQPHPEQQHSGKWEMPRSACQFKQIKMGSFWQNWLLHDHRVLSEQEPALLSLTECTEHCTAQPLSSAAAPSSRESQHSRQRQPPGILSFQIQRSTAVLLCSRFICHKSQQSTEFTAHKCSSKEAKGNKDWGGKNIFALTQQRWKLKWKAKTMQAKMTRREGKKQPLVFNAAVRMLKILFLFYLIFCAMERGAQ